MNEWKPIESAPKDRFFIDLWAVREDTFVDGKSYAIRIPDSWWNEEFGWTTYDDKKEMCSVEKDLGWTPTHWMFGPDAPTETDGVAGRE